MDPPIPPIAQGQLCDDVLLVLTKILNQTNCLSTVLVQGDCSLLPNSCIGFILQPKLGSQIQMDSTKQQFQNTKMQQRKLNLRLVIVCQHRALLNHISSTDIQRFAVVPPVDCNRIKCVRVSQNNTLYNWLIATINRSMRLVQPSEVN